ncbi:MAG: hypothetical protein HRF49_01025 [bacterium]|jgi:hypothetical protein
MKEGHHPTNRDFASRAESLQPGPDEALDRIEAASTNAAALWRYLALIPPDRPELRNLLCLMWDGVTCNSELGRLTGVHRHTVRQRKKQLKVLIERRLRTLQF